MTQHQEFNMKLEDIFGLISEYENVVFNPENEVFINSEIKIKNEHGEWCDVPALITKECEGLLVKFSDGSEVKAAKKHKMFNGFCSIDLEKTSVGDSFIKNGSYVKVTEISDIEDRIFYDLEIDSENHLYQDSQGFIHHNTEVAKRIAEALQGDQKALLRFDMSEYSEKHASAKLIGAPPGYEGFEAGGILTNEMRKNRNRIVLFDEIEKAHDSIFDLFLQILDDGRLTDNMGMVADFSEAIIIMTTNIGQTHLLDVGLTFDDAVDLTKKDLDDRYKPEFLNRFNGRQNIVCFNRLGIESIEKIVLREFNDLKRAYLESNVEVCVSEDDLRKFCVENYDPRTGARGPTGFIVANLEPVVTNFILDGGEGILNMKYENGSFSIRGK